MLRMRNFYNSERNENRFLWIVFVLALIMKLVFSLYILFKEGVVNSEYLYWASQFSQGDFVSPFSTMSRMNVAPLLSVVLSVFLKVFGSAGIPVCVFNSLLGAGIPITMYYLGKELAGNRVAVLMLIWAFFFPDFFKYVPAYLKETSVFFLLPLTVLFLVRSVNTNLRLLYVIIASVAFTVLIHIDERFIFYVVVFPLIFLISKTRIKRKVRTLLIWFGVFVVLSTPWIIRNYLVYNQIVILSTRTTVFTSKLWGENLTTFNYSSHEKAIDKFKNKHIEQAKSFKKMYGVDYREYSRNEVLLRAFINYWQPSFFKPTYITYGYRPIKWSFSHNIMGWLFYGIFLPFYMLGMFWLIKQKRLIFLFIAIIPIIHSLLHTYMVSPLERYRVPMNFIVVLVALWFISEFFHKVSLSKIGRKLFKIKSVE